MEYHYGPEQHGFRKGHSTISLLHIVETVIHTATQNNKEVAIVQIDIAKAFDKVHRTALKSFAENVIQGIAPEAATFIKSMYDGDEVEISYGKATRTLNMCSGIRQGDPLSPALFSALVGHILRPLIARWKNKGWGGRVRPHTGKRKNRNARIRRRHNAIRVVKSPSIQDDQRNVGGIRGNKPMSPP